MRQYKKQKAAMEFDPDFDTDTGRENINAIVTEFFPGFTGDLLRQIISQTPADSSQ